MVIKYFVSKGNATMITPSPPNPCPRWVVQEKNKGEMMRKCEETTPKEMLEVATNTAKEFPTTNATHAQLNHYKNKS